MITGRTVALLSFVSANLLLLIVTGLFPLLNYTGHLRPDVFNWTTCDRLALTYPLPYSPEPWAIESAFVMVLAWQGLWLLYTLVVDVLYSRVCSGDDYNPPSSASFVMYTFLLLADAGFLAWMLLFDRVDDPSLSLVGSFAALCCALFLSSIGTVVAVALHTAANARDGEEEETSRWRARISGFLAGNGSGAVTAGLWVAFVLALGILLRYRAGVDSGVVRDAGLGVMTAGTSLYWLADTLLLDPAGYTTYVLSPYSVLCTIAAGMLSAHLHDPFVQGVLGLLAGFLLIKTGLSLYRWWVMMYRK